MLLKVYHLPVNILKSNALRIQLISFKTAASVCFVFCVPPITYCFWKCPGYDLFN